MEAGNSPSKKLKIQDSSANNLPEPQKLEEDQKDELVSESTKNLMEEKVQRALVKEEERRQEEKRLEEENKNNPHDVSDEEELNSDDDVSEYNEDINPGRNILLAYYKKVGFNNILFFLLFFEKLKIFFIYFF